MRIIYCCYRDWALKIYEGIKDFPHEYMLIEGKENFIIEKIRNFKPDLILLYGWSWIVQKDVLDIAPCVCLHPSPLPKFRGGSPIQNQILRGFKKSAVTLLYMNEEIDAGDIILQKEISFEGHLQDILDRITKTGIDLTKKMLDGNLKGTPQDSSQATFYKRRQPHESELRIEDFRTKTAEELFDFVRALEDPYPNAFLRTKDGKKLLFKRVEIEDR